MSHVPEEQPVQEPQIADEEHLAETEVRGRLDATPEEQRNRESAPDPADLPGSPTGEDTGS